MRRFLIERDIPGAGGMSREQLCQAAQKSNAVLHKLGPDVQWIQSYVGGDKIFCVYMANDEKMVHEHARLSGFPANKVSEIPTVIDPATAQPGA